MNYVYDDSCEGCVCRDVCARTLDYDYADENIINNCNLTSRLRVMNQLEPQHIAIEF